VPDYATMLGILEHHDATNRFIQVWSPEDKRIEQWSIQRFEAEFSVTFCPRVLCGLNYIEELLFSGFQLSADVYFREKYLEIIRTTSGDENLILAKVSDEVGYGAFAAKDFNAGDFIVLYGGMIVGEDEISDSSYVMPAGIEGVVHDAKKYRNLAGMINHSETPNAEAAGVFDKGANHTLILATEFIRRGTQILINYGVKYWELKEDGQRPAVIDNYRIF